MRRIVSVLAFVGVVSVPPAAAQNSLSSSLVVPDHASCLTHAALAEHTRTWLGREEIDVRVSIVVELGADERHDVGFVLLEAEQVASRRVFPVLPEACSDRRAAFSLALAIALDASILSTLGGARPSNPNEPNETNPSPSESSPSEPTSNESSPSEPTANEPVSDASSESVAPQFEPSELEAVPSSPVHLDVGIDLGVGVGALPTWEWLGGVELALRRDSWQVRLAGRVSTRSTSSIGEGRVRTQLAYGELTACLQTANVVGARACVGPAVGRVLAEGEGFDQALDARVWWGAVVGELSARWPVDSPIALRVGVRGHVKWMRPVLSVQATDGSALYENRFSIGGVTGIVGLVVQIR